GILPGLTSSTGSRGKWRPKAEAWTYTGAGAYPEFLPTLTNSLNRKTQAGAGSARVLVVGVFRSRPPGRQPAQERQRPKKLGAGDLRGSEPRTAGSKSGKGPRASLSAIPASRSTPSNLQPQPP